MGFQEEGDQSNNENNVNSSRISDVSKELALKYSVLVTEPSCPDSPDSPEYEMSKLTSKSPYSDLHPIMTKTQSWNSRLLLCCIVASIASLQFGFNITSLNTNTHRIQDFTYENFFMFQKLHLGKIWLKGNATKLAEAKIRGESKKARVVECKFAFWLDENCEKDVKKIMIEKDEKLAAGNKKFGTKFTDTDDLINHAEGVLLEKSKLVDDGEIKVRSVVKHFWIFLNTAFIFGGLVGALISKLTLDTLGRRKAILFNCAITLLPAGLMLATPFHMSPLILLFTRFWYGVQGGMACSFGPTYCAEIAPPNLRGSACAMPHIFITIGILFGQILGLDTFLGTDSLWFLLLGFPLFPALFTFALMSFLPESPTALLMASMENTDEAKRLEEEAVKTLRFLRCEHNVLAEMEAIKSEVTVNMKMSGSKDDTEGESTLSVLQLLKTPGLRQGLLIVVLLQIAAQFSGINVMFLYSWSIFVNAGIPSHLIQYAIMSLGVVNLLATFVGMLMIDRVDRRRMLVFPIAVICLSLVVLTMSVNYVQVPEPSYVRPDWMPKAKTTTPATPEFTTSTMSYDDREQLLAKIKDANHFYSLLALSAQMTFIVAYALSLGPIPFIFAVEMFGQNSRSAAMLVCVFVNWSSSFFVITFFPPLFDKLNALAFLVSLGAMFLILLFTLFKIPETRGKSPEQIQRLLGDKRSYDFEQLNNNTATTVRS